MASQAFLGGKRSFKGEHISLAVLATNTCLLTHLEILPPLEAGTHTLLTITPASIHAHNDLSSLRTAPCFKADPKIFLCRFSLTMGNTLLKNPQVISAHADPKTLSRSPDKHSRSHPAGWSTVGLGSSVRSRKVNLMILMAAFQHRIFCDFLHQSSLETLTSLLSS